jgi:catechol 2,3-dioxygenase-like lactoylglutathione lyase family enzyme
VDPLVRLVSSVIFVAQLDRSVAFYGEVFACREAVRDPGAALLVSPDGFQMYLVAKGSRAQHPSGHIGLQCLMWSTDSAEALDTVERVLGEHGAGPDRYTSGGVTFVCGRDPDGINVVVAHPAPTVLPRHIIAPRLYNT